MLQWLLTTSFNFQTIVSLPRNSVNNSISVIISNIKVYLVCKFDHDRPQFPCMNTKLTSSKSLRNYYNDPLRQSIIYTHLFDITHELNDITRNFDIKILRTIFGAPEPIEKNVFTATVWSQ